MIALRRTLEQLRCAVIGLRMDSKLQCVGLTFGSFMFFYSFFINFVHFFTCILLTYLIWNLTWHAVVG